MDKCWFVLHQTHYPAPEYKYESMAYGEAEGPLCLGHFIPSPKEVDQVINSDGITPFPRDMRIWPTTAVNFRFSEKTEKDIEISAKAGYPNTAAVGISANVEAGVVFKRIMGDTWAIDRLDTQIVQPTLAYLEQCRKSAKIATWVEKKKVLGTWKVYMISGLMIARGAKNEQAQKAETEAHAGGGANLPGATTVEAKVKHGDKKEVETSGQFVNDFVWAFRLSEVSKGLFGSDLSQTVVTKGTVFAPGSDNPDGKAILIKEGLMDGSDMSIFEVLKGDEREFLITMDGY